jgi:hypothetical protein
MDIQTVLPYELTETGAKTSIHVTLPNGWDYTQHIPMPSNSIRTMTISYTQKEGLSIAVSSLSGASLFQFVSAVTLQRFANKPSVLPEATLPLQERTV